MQLNALFIIFTRMVIVQHLATRKGFFVNPESSVAQTIEYYTDTPVH